MLKRYLIILIILATAGVQTLEIAGETSSYHTALYDDGYYYLQVGRNIADGKGPTFDGENFTNGYHPLWMSLVILSYKIIPNNPIAPIVLLKILAVLAFLGTLLILWKILRMITPNLWLAGALTFFYAANPWNVLTPTDGLETSLAVFIFSILFFVFLKILEKPEEKRLYLILGVLAGIMILGRADYILFGAAAFLYLAFTQKNSRIAKIFLLGVPAAIIVLPWLAYSYLNFGTPVQESGLAYTIINRNLFLQNPRTGLDMVLWSGYELFKNALKILTYIGIPIPETNLQPKTVIWETLIVASLLIFLFKKFIVRKNKEAFKAAFRKDVIGKALMVMFAAFVIFTIMQAGIRWSARPWYFMMAPFLFAVALAVLLEKVFKIGTSAVRTKKTLLTVGVLFLLLNWYIYGSKLGLGITGYTRREPPTQYLVAAWMNENLPENARIASFNSGEIGYYTNWFVMNADGLVNHGVYEVMRDKKRLWDFFRTQRIEYIVDTEVTVAERYKWLLGIPDPLSHLEVIKSFTTSYQSRLLNVYKIIAF